MIRFIAVIDKKRGTADEHGIPWQGKLPSDIRLFREKTKHNTVLMGYGTYIEFDKPLSDRENYVATTKQESLREGFTAVHDARRFLQAYTGNQKDVWVIGGANLFTTTLDLADELYITHVDGDFNCTKFFPEFEEMFPVGECQPWQEENNIRFRFCVYKKKQES